MYELSTPLGTVQVLLDGKPIDFEASELTADEKQFPDVCGRYKIVCFHACDGLEHSLACVLRDFDAAKIETDNESGESLEAIAFYGKDTKLTIGAKGESYTIGMRFSPFDYDTIPLSHGVSYEILSSTRTRRYVFGISWIAPVTQENDAQTWYSADPYYF